MKKSVLIAIPCPDKHDYCPAFYRAEERWLVEDDHGNTATIGLADFDVIVSWARSSTATTEAQFAQIIAEGKFPKGIVLVADNEDAKVIDFSGALMSREQLAAFCVEAVAGNFDPDVVEAKILAAV